VRHGKKIEDVQVPGFLPDVPEVRSDIADYAFEIEWYDRQLARILALLEKCGELDRTIIVLTADNGMAFPRAKATAYDYGTRMPLAVRWGERVKPGRVVDDFVSFIDFAPTFLEAAGLPARPEMTGRSLLPVLLSAQSGQVQRERDSVVFGLERHFPGSRPNGAGYPMRAIRTRDYLMIRNLAPDANPMGDRPGPAWPADDPVSGFGDTDGGPAKSYLWEHRAQYPELFQAAFGKRPAFELYAVRQDPYNLRNLAGDPAHRRLEKDLGARLDEYLARTQDPRTTERADEFDRIMKRFPKLGS
jgi:uncharacterized sulfatase